MPHSSHLGSLLELLALDRLPRTGWLLAGVAAPESVAAHSLGTALVALALGPRVAPALAVDRCVTLASLHDAPEAWITDLPRRASERLPEGAKAEAEAAAAKELLGGLSEFSLHAYREYRAGETREARFVALCDRLHLGLRLLGYHRSGQRGLADFVDGLARLDCAEFEPCEELRRELLDALRVPPTNP